MKSLEELKRENERLRAVAEVNRDFIERNRERKRLIAENRKLKYAKAYNIASRTGSLIRKGAVKLNEKAVTLNKKINENKKKSLVKKKKTPIKKSKPVNMFAPTMKW